MTVINHKDHIRLEKDYYFGKVIVRRKKHDKFSPLPKNNYKTTQGRKKA